MTQNTIFFTGFFILIIFDNILGSYHHYMNFSKLGLDTTLVNKNVFHTFQDLLLKRTSIDEASDTYFGAAAATTSETLEHELKLDKSNIRSRGRLKSFLEDSSVKLLISDLKTKNILSNFLEGRRLSDVIDIVISVTSGLEFLESWKPFLKSFHFIIIQVTNSSTSLSIPAWMDYELYDRNDIELALGNHSWIISETEISLRSFGFLVSDKQFIYTFDHDCLPVIYEDKLMNPIPQHLLNLITPATPHPTNTTYDKQGPHSVHVHDGIETVISHGLWIHSNDFEFSKVSKSSQYKQQQQHEESETLQDITLTIPYKQLYPMSSTNLAFNRHLIGPAMMFSSYLSGGDCQSCGRLGVLFAGFASKVIADHLFYGVKSGHPYVNNSISKNSHNDIKIQQSKTKASFKQQQQQQQQGKQEEAALWRTQKMFEFFQNVTLSQSSNTSNLAYLELIRKLRKSLGSRDPSFSRLADAMIVWVNLWESRFGGHGGHKDCTYPIHDMDMACVVKWLPRASRSSIGPSPHSTCAVFTVTHNEKEFLPIWIRYYRQFVPLKDMWILDHNTKDGSTDPDKIPVGINLIRLHGEGAFMPHHFLNRQVELHQQRLLRAGYKCVLFTEIDEFVVADPKKYKSGLLTEYFTQFIDNPSIQNVRTFGYQVAHVSIGENLSTIEPDINWNKSLIQQRNYWLYNSYFSKPLLTKLPLRYGPGFHTATDGKKSWDRLDIKIDPQLILFHTHSIDQKYCYLRERNKWLNAKKRGKREEDGLGMIGNGIHVDDFETIKFGKTVCGDAYSFFNKTAYITSFGKVLKKMNQKWKSVSV